MEQTPGEPVMRKPWFWEGGKPSRNTLRAIAAGLRTAARAYERNGEAERAAELRRHARIIEPEEGENQ